jgi:hypothetical protein
MPSTGGLTLNFENEVVNMRPGLDSQALVSHSIGDHQLSLLNSLMIGS